MTKSIFVETVGAQICLVIEVRPDPARLAELEDEAKEEARLLEQKIWLAALREVPGA